MWSRRAPEERFIGVRFTVPALFAGVVRLGGWSPPATGRGFMYTVYVLKSLKNNRLYTGSTNNIERRLKEHNGGHIGYTKFTRPFSLLYREEYPSRSEAYIRERFLKSGKGREFLKKIL